MATTAAPKKGDKKSTKTAPSNKAKGEVVKKNLDGATKKAKDPKKEDEGRASKYLYPKGMSNPEKKEFRRKARAQAEAFSNKISELKKGGPEKEAELKKVRKEKAAWEEATYAPTA